MKKFFYLFAFIGVIIYLLSCDNDKSECIDCKTKSSDYVDITILDYPGRLKSYTTGNYTFMHKYENDFSIFDSFISNNNLPLNKNLIVSFVIYTTNNIYNNNTNFSVSQNDIKAIIAYEKSTITDELIAKVFIRQQNNSFVLSKFSGLKTKYVSYNDIFSISELTFSNDNITAIAYINYPVLPKDNLFRSQLQITLDDEMTITGRASKKCSPPCQGYEGYCVAQERQNGPESWTCLPSECPKEDVDEGIGGPNGPQLPPDYSVVAKSNSDLRSFRDNFLIKYPRGRKYINLYYGLRVPKQNLTVDFCYKTFDMIINKIIPLTSNLEKNPNSQAILIDNATKTEIISYLNDVKTRYTDSVSKDKIDTIINDVNYLSNKSNAAITAYMQN